MSSSADRIAQATDPPSPDAVRAQLKRVLESADFRANERRRQFLSYVVEQTLAGSAQSLKGFTIAVAVLGRDETFDPQTDPVVRLEARRLRRDLEHYYLSAGRDDPVRIEIPKGGYVPVFIQMREADESPEATVDPAKSHDDPQRRSRVLVVAAAVTLVAAGALGMWLVVGIGKSPPGSRFTSDPEAYTLFFETRRISRPPSNEQRVLAALDLSREIVELDPDFGGGYAAESFHYWSYIVFGHSKSPSEDTARALELAEKAITVDPEFGWGYQSLSRARHLAQDLDGAVLAAEYAVELQPEVPEMQGNLGLVLALAGRAEEGIAPLHEAIRLSGEDARNPYRNYLGIALFHAGRFDEAIEALEANRSLGGPSGPHMQAYLAAAYGSAGQAAHAHAAAERVRAASPAFSVSAFLERLFPAPAAREPLYTALKQAGLDPTAL